jgi:hypothetical protein
MKIVQEKWLVQLHMLGCHQQQQYMAHKFGVGVERKFGYEKLDFAWNLIFIMKF